MASLHTFLDALNAEDDKEVGAGMLLAHVLHGLCTAVCACWQGVGGAGCPHCGGGAAGNLLICGGCVAGLTALRKECDMP